MAKDIFKADIFKDGDFNIAFSDEQHIEDVLMSAPGHIKNAPLLGVNIMDYVNAPMSPSTVAELERKIRLNLETDGAKNITVKIDSKTNEISTNGTYN